MSSMIPRSRLFDDFLRDLPLTMSLRPLHGDPLPSPDRIKVDVRENGSTVTVSAELPGVDKKDIHVDVDGGMVTIRAEVKQYDADTKDDKVIHSERYFGTVQRSFSLPCPVDEARAKAAYKDGVLTLTLPKSAPNGAKRIAID